MESGGFMYHVHLKPGGCGKYALLTGDPGRVEEIASRLDEPRLLSVNREFTVWNGYLDNSPVTVCSTGIGGPSAVIALQELAECGADTFIRVGTCGGMQHKVIGGDIVVAASAIRGDGTSAEYLPLEFPAAADFSVTSALAESAAKHSSSSEGNRYHIGVVQSKDSFYSQHRPEDMPLSRFLLARWEAYIRGGALASEMECASLYIAAQSFGLRAGGVLTAVWNQERQKAGLPNPRVYDSSRCIDVAVDALKRLIKQAPGRS